jgi:hypothetical protein
MTVAHSFLIIAHCSLSINHHNATIFFCTLIFIKTLRGAYIFFILLYSSTRNQLTQHITLAYCWLIGLFVFKRTLASLSSYRPRVALAYWLIAHSKSKAAEFGSFTLIVGKIPIITEIRYGRTGKNKWGSFCTCMYMIKYQQPPTKHEKDLYRSLQSSAQYILQSI